MNIFIQELKYYKKSILIWSFSLVGLFLLYFSIFPSFLSAKEEFESILKSYPPQLIKAIGADNIFTVINFYAYVFSFMVICGAIQAMNMGLSIISKEIRFKTADFLLTKPINRFKIISAKLLAGITGLLITNIIYVVLTFIIAKIFSPEEFDITIFLLISFSMFFLQLIFFAVRNFYCSNSS